jgi:hypothetical protein
MVEVALEAEVAAVVDAPLVRNLRVRIKSFVFKAKHI